MRPLDLFRLSTSNLFKRKLRTILTVLGVTIGVASIVVMVSLGLGLKKSLTEEMAQYSSLTSVSVRDASQGGYRMAGGADSSAGTGTEEKHLSDEAIIELSQLPNVKKVHPVLETSAFLTKGNWQAYATVRGVEEGYLDEQNIDIDRGDFPKETGNTPELFYGNMILAQFSSKNGSAGYWEDGILPDIDLMNDPISIVFDMDRYFSFRNNTPGEDGSAPIKPKKYILPASGVQAGGPEDYNTHAYYIYTNINDLKNLLKKEFKGRNIPDQPLRKNGKPYKEIFYTELIVETDSMDHVSELQSLINSMGYSAMSDAEWIAQEQKTMDVIQLVLGGIGAVSLLVAAIGITNTMMMSIYERTKEIGIIKVLGCDMRNIQAMFLIEAGVIGLIGGVAGLMISYALSAVINIVASSSQLMELSGNISYIPIWLAFASLIFAILVGMVAGFFPSLRAMKLSPLAAIRNE